MTRIDHAARSNRRMEQTLSSYETGEDAGAIVVALAALNDATLALVEQQRIANEKIAKVAVQEKAQVIGEFLDYDTNYVLAERVDCTRELHDDADFGGWSYGDCPFHDHLVPVSKSIERILADYFEIELPW